MAIPVKLATQSVDLNTGAKTLRAYFRDVPVRGGLIPHVAGVMIELHGSVTITAATTAEALYSTFLDSLFSARIKAYDSAGVEIVDIDVDRLYLLNQAWRGEIVDEPSIPADGNAQTIMAALYVPLSHVPRRAAAPYSQPTDRLNRAEIAIDTGGLSSDVAALSATLNIYALATYMQSRNQAPLIRVKQYHKNNPMSSQEIDGGLLEIAAVPVSGNITEVQSLSWGGGQVANVDAGWMWVQYAEERVLRGYDSSDAPYHSTLAGCWESTPSVVPLVWTQRYSPTYSHKGPVTWQFGDNDSTDYEVIVVSQG